MKRKSSLVWKYFEDAAKDQAKCQLCGRLVPNKGKNTSNLRSHLLHQHRERYDKLYGGVTNNKPTRNDSLAKGTPVARKRLLPRRRLPDTKVKKEPEESTSSTCYEVLAAEVLKDFERDEEAAEEQAQEPEIEDVWNYFEKLPSNRAQCILCKETFNRHLPFLTRHMKEKHRKIAWDQPSDSDEDQNCYTEVVYLEEEQPTNVTTTTKQPQVTKKRRLSSRYELVNKPKDVENISKIDEIDDEIEIFGRYVISLLKKMPKDASTQLQMDIIGMIMKAKLKLGTTEPVSVSVSNVQDGVIVTPGNIIVTTPSNVIHTTQNNESLPTLVIGVENET
ncbi:uncharacterized protein [Maniola hyperantus]|uniref:uncharacterized protein isoform X3 n=1 Tax=Aphantopus hyperantus TaxID=2795564 RepID=UPI0021435363